MRLPATLLAEDGAITLKLAELGFDSVGRGYYQQIAQAQFISGHFGEFSGIAGAETLRQINYSFLGIDLGATPQWKFWEFDWSSPDKWVPMLLLFLVPVVTTGITVIQTLITQKMSPTPIAEGQAASSSKMMLMMMPAMMLFFGFAAPAALGIYWSAGAVLNILRDIWLTKRYNRLMDEEDETRSAARAAKEAELERKRRETERLRAENKTALNPSTSKKKRELAERKERESKTAEWEKKRSPAKETAEDPARVGTRRYARGRAYDPYRYDGGSDSGGEESEETDDLEVSEYAENQEDFDDTEASEYEEAQEEDQEE
jgi:YidC/Oxa1 family membrane protein insertase